MDTAITSRVLPSSSDVFSARPAGKVQDQDSENPPEIVVKKTPENSEVVLHDHRRDRPQQPDRAPNPEPKFNGSFTAFPAPLAFEVRRTDPTRQVVLTIPLAEQAYQQQQKLAETHHENEGKDVLA